jgi:hypothetical protein
MRPAADARQQVQRRGRQAVREHRCRMRARRCFAVAKARPTHQQQGLDALQGLAGCARAAGGAPNMFATKLPCLCWQGARIISPGGECALEPARAVKPGCFVAPSIVRSLACDALRCDAMRWSARCRAVSGTPDEAHHTTPQYAASSMLFGTLAESSLSSAVHRMTRST